MNGTTRQALKAAIDQRRRASLGREARLDRHDGVTAVHPDKAWHGTESGYCYHQCRCSACTRAHSAARSARKQRQLAA